MDHKRHAISLVIEEAADSAFGCHLNELLTNDEFSDDSTRPAAQMVRHFEEMCDLMESDS